MKKSTLLIFLIFSFFFFRINSSYADIKTGLAAKFDIVPINSNNFSTDTTTAESVNQNYGLTNNLTLSAWVYFNNLSGWQTLIGQDTSSWSGGNAAFYLNKVNNNFARCGRFPNQLNIYLAVNANSCDSGDWAGSTTVPVIYTWYMVTGTYDGSNMKLYVNGVLEGTSPRTGNIGTQMGNLNIGSGYYQGNQVDKVDGVIDDVRIYNRALSGDGVTELYNDQKSAHSG